MRVVIRLSKDLPQRSFFKVLLSAPWRFSREEAIQWKLIGPVKELEIMNKWIEELIKRQKIEDRKLKLLEEIFTLRWNRRAFRLSEHRKVCYPEKPFWRSYAENGQTFNANNGLSRKLKESKYEEQSHRKEI